MNNIIDPITSKSYSILSNYGKSILKKYISKTITNQLDHLKPEGNLIINDLCAQLF